MLRFSSVIFDLDGLIVDTEPLHQRAFNAILSTLGVEHRYSTKEYGELFTGRSVIENAEYVREVFALPQTAEQISRAHLALFTLLISDADNLDPMPGVGEILAWLATKHARIAIASSSRPDQVQLVLRGLNMHEHFAAIVANDGSLKPKPAPDVYLLALEALGARPEDTLALEDSNSGVRAARAAGMFVIGVPNEFTASQDLNAANLILPDLTRVREYLENGPVEV
jgi:HAD superfamily hydrolase (TIGR01509 family)